LVSGWNFFASWRRMIRSVKTKVYQITQRRRNQIKSKNGRNKIMERMIQSACNK